MRPRLLDLFCGAGGCSVGYARAGFDVVGVDIEPHEDYPFPLTVTDALDVLRDPDFLAGFDVVHASPPCQRYSKANRATRRPSDHPDLLPVVRRLLTTSGGVWVIENVPEAEITGVTVCAGAVGLPDLRRHRVFESSVPLVGSGCACDGRGTLSVFGHSGEDRRPSTVAKHGKWLKHVPKSEVQRAMGIDWMTRRSDLSDAIPPAYTDFLGRQLLDVIA